MPDEPRRDEIDQVPGPVLLEFGASWCPHCQAIQAELGRCLEDHRQVRHVRVEDGPGRPLGRSFHVKLWPTLIFLRDGRIVNRLIRPSAREIRQTMVDFLSASPER